jgi:hypothetical protein
VGDREAYLQHIRENPEQLERVHRAYSTGRWWTEHALAQAVQGSPHAMSARRSDLKKLGCVFEKKYAGNGVYLYRLVGHAIVCARGGASA